MEHILNHEKAHQKYFEEMTAIPHGSIMSRHTVRIWWRLQRNTD